MIFTKIFLFVSQVFAYLAGYGWVKTKKRLPSETGFYDIVILDKSDKNKTRKYVMQAFFNNGENFETDWGDEILMDIVESWRKKAPPFICLG